MIEYIRIYWKENITYVLTDAFLPFTLSRLLLLLVGWLSQYFLKITSFVDITDEDTKLVTHLLNNRLRKFLDFKTPVEVLLGHSVALHSWI